MKYSKIILASRTDMPLALSNDFPKPYQVEDAVEESENISEMLMRLRLCDTYAVSINLHHENSQKVRFELIDVFGNLHYLTVRF